MLKTNPMYTTPAGSTPTRVDMTGATSAVDIVTREAVLVGAFVNTAIATTAVNINNGTVTMYVIPVGQAAGSKILFDDAVFSNGISLSVATSTGAGDLTITWV